MLLLQAPETVHIQHCISFKFQVDSCVSMCEVRTTSPMLCVLLMVAYAEQMRMQRRLETFIRQPEGTAASANLTPPR